MQRRISVFLGIGLLVASLAFPRATSLPPSEQPAALRPADKPSIAASQAAQVRRNVRGIPLAFEVNRGQFAAPVQFSARGEQFALLLERDGMHFEMRPPKGPAHHSTSRDSIALRFAGSTADLVWRGRDELQGVANYFLGNDRSRWKTNVALFAGAGAQAMGPGVDCFLYAGANGLEMDFDVASGADIRRVKLDVRGAKGLRLDDAGDLLIESRGAAIRLRKPAIYQMQEGRRINVEGGYAIASAQEVAFRIGAYDRNLPLVIDPSVAVTYTTFLGGSGADSASGVAVDASGAVYISGTTTSASSFGETATKKLGPLGGASDFFVAKIDPMLNGAESLVYLTFIGGSGEEEGGQIALNTNRGLATYLDLAVVGTTTSTDYPTTDGSKLVNGTNDLALTLLDPTGSTLVFSTVLDGTGAFATQLNSAGDHGNPAVAFAASGAVMVAADTTAADLPVTAGAFQTAYGGTVQTVTPAAPESDGMLAVYNVPTLSYLTYFGINGYTNFEGNFVPATVGVTGLAIDLVGQAYVTGFLSQPGTFPTTNGFQTTYGGGIFDGFLMCFTPKGLGSSDLIYSTYIGGSALDQAFAVAVDQAIPANAYVVGATRSPNLLTLTVPTVSGYQTSLNAVTLLTNAFLVAVAQSQSGVSSLSYATYLGGSGSDSALGVAALGANAVYLTGHTESANFPTLNSLQSFSGSGDAYLAKLDTTAAGAASLLYATLLGGGSDAQGNGVAALPTGEIVVAGSTTSNDFPQAGNPQTGVQPICASCQESPAQPDAFVVAFAESAATGPIVSFNAAQLNFGGQLVNSANPQQVGILTNAGTTALTITGIAITGANASDFSQSNDCPVGPATMAPQATCQINVNFFPTIAGTESAALSFTDDAVGSPQELTLTGTGQEPLSSLSAAVVNFGSQPAGTVSSQQTITLTNGGNLALAISEVNVTGPDVAQFRFSGNNTCVNPPIVQPGGNCIMNIQFAPETMGTFNASIVLTDNSGNVNTATQAVQLTGIGSAPAPTANVAPSALNFGSLSVGSASGPQSVALNNTGSLPLQVSAISMSGPNSAEFKITSGTTCPISGGSVGIAGLCGINVLFAPASTGSKAASISFVDNASNSPQNVSLSGTGINLPSLTISSNSIGFQPQTLNVASTSPITLSNAGAMAIQISSIALNGPNAGNFSQNNNCPPTLNPEPTGGPPSTCKIAITFQPTAGGALTASLAITDNAAGSPQVVTLSGTGLVPAATLSASTLSFAPQLAGTSSAPAVLTLTNSASGPQAGGLVVSGTSVSGTNAAEFLATPNCGTMVAAGNSCGISVVFKPQAGQAGAAVATLSIKDNALNSPQTIALTGSATDFSLAASTSGSLSAVVNAGVTAQYSLQVNPLDGFAGNVAVACTGAPVEATCSVTPSPVVVSGTSPAPFSVSVVTQAATAYAPNIAKRWPLSRWPASVPSEVLLCLEAIVLVSVALCIGRFGKRRRWARLAAASVYVAVLLAAAALTSCGSSSGSGQAAAQLGTPTGTYMLTVTGTFTPAGAATGVSRKLQLTLAVQQGAD
jgi:Abnormal spindle-like microcephaly-assoc'd, ASPM-SPD-2-Hydin